MSKNKRKWPNCSGLLPCCLSFWSHACFCYNPKTTSLRFPCSIIRQSYKLHWSLPKKASKKIPSLAAFGKSTAPASNTAKFLRMSQTHWFPLKTNALSSIRVSIFAHWLAPLHLLGVLAEHPQYLSSWQNYCSPYNSVSAKKLRALVALDSSCLMSAVYSVSLDG